MYTEVDKKKRCLLFQPIKVQRLKKKQPCGKEELIKLAVAVPKNWPSERQSTDTNKVSKLSSD
jgi:hypothetical protein